MVFKLENCITACRLMSLNLYSMFMIGKSVMSMVPNIIAHDMHPFKASIIANVTWYSDGYLEKLEHDNSLSAIVKYSCEGKVPNNGKGDLHSKLISAFY
ncbi:hypothetical protein AQUCO_02300188v1 [Aquilegia coerulea]|uniref:Uncharacterized protein n=1 Tax=Aquilegia coerulea TaxID=218851 RepID=A0A2G5DCF6_AQUCA|nr:hypothetical protein AQUCO_02300188v1 [Aquilegia coerulea]